ncbi:hypothetical protein BDV95DRAFT_622660 [Massariosphaeria phaeospora]|uniref:3'-5' exonuclease domain-containing protein n=1 Tax=Massariosphaeria phaeospora TaxID=100035 RepID=A0A7C8I1U1_9PLEO|nr:hypothetical protein BDV95DRAFT_622660 [Massariosphaeria phaeospora]
MAPTTSATISVQRIWIPDDHPAFLQSLVDAPNNPASLYLSVSSRSLVIYVAPTSTVNIVSLPHLSVALSQEHNSAIALKTFLESGKITKVFFDARSPAKILFEHCDIALVTCFPGRTYIHEVQLMAGALRKSDTAREWLPGFDRCITQDSDLDFDNLILDRAHGADRADEAASFDMRILHLPILWRKYHDQLVECRPGIGGSFWVAMIREATRERLKILRGNEPPSYDAKRGWDKYSIQTQREIWNDDVFMDSTTHGEWFSGDFLGGSEHWAQYDVL